MRDGFASAITLVEIFSAGCANALTVLLAEMLHRKEKHDFIGAKVLGIELRIGDFYNVVALAVGQLRYKHTLDMNVMLFYGFFSAAVARSDKLHLAVKICRYDACAVKNASPYGNRLFNRADT